MSQTLQTSNLLAVPLAPLVGSVLAGVFGTQFGGNWLGRRITHSLTILGVLVAFILSAQTLWSVGVDGARFNETLYTWMVVGGLKMEIGFLIDGLTAMMMCVVTFVSLMVHIYTIGYMEEDEGYNRFFSYISLFTFSMLMLVMSNNMLQLFFGWEAVGLVSYLLIGFWFNKPTAIFANMKAFLVNRVGDFGFILGIGLIAAFAGTLNYTEAFGKSADLAALNLPGTEWMLVTVICICLFIGAMGKSAQFPLHVWLPDSMEGPTPISALIHAATMVTAGIFMVARMSPLFELSDTALNLVMVIGAITALFMGFLGLIQNDIKRVVAYSTLSQLGYMTVALGASAYSVAVFHLMTHAFFKALLFLGAGSVIMGMHHNQDIRWMGGARTGLPLSLQLSGHEVVERRHPDAQRLVHPALHRRRTVAEPARSETASDAEAGGAAAPRDARQHHAGRYRARPLRRHRHDCGGGQASASPLHRYRAPSGLCRSRHRAGAAHQARGRSGDGDLAHQARHSARSLRQRGGAWADRPGNPGLRSPTPRHRYRNGGRIADVRRAARLNP